MKKAERIIVYGIAIFASLYSLWAHGKLQRIYRINRETLIPAYDKLKKSEIPDTELLVPGYEKIKNIEIPSSIALYDYEFKEDHRDQRDGYVKIIWHTWYFSSYSHWVNAYYLIEFRNSNGSLLVELEPIEATFIPTGKSSGGLPREHIGEYWMESRFFPQFDCTKSLISLIVKN